MTTQHDGRTDHQQARPDDVAAARRVDPKTGKPDQLHEEGRKAESRQEALVDEGIEETFPASDPVSVKRIT
ncbi:hypothetical protein [Brevundimonas sp.]|uniref:hypothetical protein n=1 Tax=Brevundimonas sp. TaxID=1871086 RepID=UPI002D6B40FC|nr:hypothetical protein [Brevundimonas sp.]HYC96870.1 hypothetical protein [Brevundimonas sp.]